jgi:hypothetical protein
MLEIDSSVPVKSVKHSFIFAVLNKKLRKQLSCCLRSVLAYVTDTSLSKLCVNKKSCRIARIIFPTFAYTNHPKIWCFFAYVCSTIIFVFSYPRYRKEWAFRRLLNVLLWENNTFFEGHFSFDYTLYLYRKFARAQSLLKKTGTRTLCAGLWLQLPPDLKSSWNLALYTIFMFIHAFMAI